MGKEGSPGQVALNIGKPGARGQGSGVPASPAWGYLAGMFPGARGRGSWAVRLLCVALARGSIPSCRNSSLNTDVRDRRGKGRAWTWRHRLGSGAEKQRCAAIIAGDTSRNSVIPPSLSSASLQAPLNPSPPQMSFPKATVQKLRGTSPWELFLAVFSSC